MRLWRAGGKIDGKQPPLSAEEEKAEAEARKEPVGHAVHRHEFLLRGLAERCDNLEFEVGENGRFSDRARILLAQGVSIERRLKVVEEGLIELQLYQLERRLCRQSRRAVEQDRRIEELESQIQGLIRVAEEQAALSAKKPRQ